MRPYLYSLFLENTIKSGRFTETGIFIHPLTHSPMYICLPDRLYLYVIYLSFLLFTLVTLIFKGS